VLALAGTAAAAADDLSVGSPGPVKLLARSGLFVGFVSGQIAGDCDHVELWGLANNGVYRLGKKSEGLCLQGPSTGAGVTGVAVAGNRALWLEYAGGNLRDWILNTATTTAPKPRELEFEEVDVDAASPILVGDGSDSLLPYSVYTKVVALSSAGRKMYAWKAPTTPRAITSYGSQVGVLLPGDKVVVLSPTGTVAQTYTFPLGAVAFKLAGIGVIVQLPHGLVQIRKGAKLVKSLTLPEGAQLLDYAGGILLYSRGIEIRGVRVGTGTDVLLRKVPKRPVLAQLELNGLSYAIGKHVYSVAMVNVQTALNG